MTAIRTSAALATALTLQGLMATASWAQPPASPGQPPAPSASVAEPTRITLTAVRFSPTVAVSPQDLQAAVARFVGKPISSAELPLISTSVRALYEARGLGLVGIGLPDQNLNDGVLSIAIVEPRVGRVLIDSVGPAPLTTTRITGVLTGMGIAAGKPLNLLQLDRAMFTLNDWPGVAAKATLTPAGDEGQYTVAIQVEPRRAWDATVDADNHGAAVSGKYHLGALLRWNNPAGWGDNLDLRVVASSGSGNAVGRLAYELPVGPSPWRLGLGYSHVNYALGDSLASLNATGTANVMDASLSYPLLRTRNHNLVSRLAFEDKHLTDEFSGSSTQKQLQALTLGLAFEARDRWLGGGFSGGSLGVQSGQLKSSTEGRFSKVSLQLTRLQALTKTLSLFGGVTAQWADQNLDSSEKFTLGGPKGVRAYPAAETPADQAAVLSAELRWWMAPQWSSFVFYDAGHGTLVRRPDPLTTTSNTRNLHGAGLGLQYTNPSWVTVKATVGVRGQAPVQSDTTDQARTRLMLQLLHTF